jgi:hypothetical protein
MASARSPLPRLLAVAASLCVIAACDDASNSSPSNPTPTLTSIAIHVQTGALNPIEGQRVTLSATGTLSDNTTQDLTATAQWSSSNTALASMSGSLVQARRAGTVTVTATQAGVTGNVQMTILAAAVKRQASVAIPRTYLYDLDLGVFPSDYSGDIWYEVLDSGVAQLSFSGAPTAALGVAVGATEPSRGECGFATGYSGNSVPVSSLTAGEYFCVRTSGNLTAWVRIDQVPVVDSPSQDLAAMKLTYRLWES